MRNLTLEQLIQRWRKGAEEQTGEYEQCDSIELERCATELESALASMEDERGHDCQPTISVHELQHWFARYALEHQGTERERIADEIADFIDQARAKS